MKHCPKCEQDKALDDFGNRSHTKDGKSYWCKVCHNDNVKAHHKTEQGKKTLSKNYKKYYNKDIDQSRLYHKDYRDNNPEQLKQTRSKAVKEGKVAKYQRDKRKSDQHFRLRGILTNRIRTALKFKTKAKQTLILLGCSLEEFKAHLESQFTEGMSWDNQGQFGWHIDHIVPCSYFDLLDSFQQQLCFHWTNYQPLWRNDNIKKSNKLTPEVKELLGIIE